ncbi:RnfH family protein [Wenzhouxiangella sp. XN79A]|uniref:RnfH family protein n=1 Tax=Wenzhouxiangella sp. XN79A TaxID=2724193 RepID=UPI00144AEFE2|nr:RnfH family protein [Wenzhouxiangella sp. XN79A]NKI34811.1 RnfH family protein [Wenzhouxiangella sp. XN79A]
MGADRIRVEVVAAWPQRQWMVELDLPAGSTVADAVERSGLVERIPGLEPRDDHLGVFGRLCRPDRELADGDRVEIYRPLKLDPKTIRRINAERQRRGE